MTLNSIFCSGMVLQAEEPIRIFGTGAGTARVKIDGATGEAVSHGDSWLIELPAHCYGGPYTMSVTLDGEEQIFEDIYFGDVLLIAGQSNVQVKLFETTTPRENYRNNPLVRLFTLERPEDGEFFFPADGWVRAEGENISKTTAIGYLAGDILSQRTGHAVGLIACYQGASMIQSWLPKGIFKGTPYEIAAEEHSGDARPKEYMLWNHDGFLYEKMFKEIIPLSINSVIWYQGESNADTPDHITPVYKGELQALIDCWRRDLKNSDLPFIIVQLPDLNGVSDPAGWKAIQQAQAEISQGAHKVYTVVSADICESNNIHPPTKLPLAKRIADLL